MFIINQNREKKEEYIKLLKVLGAFSKLFTNNENVFLPYRVAENLFCRVFNATNISRSDLSVDAIKNRIGIGVKTFLENNGRTFQKIAEFDKSLNLYSKYLNNNLKLIEKISSLRNKRIQATISICNLNKTIYHCITRGKDFIYIYEHSMNFIEISSISNIDRKNNVIYFKDGKEDYNFNLSKSTLSKRFITRNPLLVNIKTFDEPFSALERFYEDNLELLISPLEDFLESVILPLYSYKNSNVKYVPERSGLNQWNAGGRPRDTKEAYIRIPLLIHSKFPGFFPSRYKPFNLYLPNGIILSAKVCQDNAKALMSNPNKALGDWLINDVLKIQEGELVTYELLEEIGIDSVEITKRDEENFSIDFKEIGAYEDFTARV